MSRLTRKRNTHSSREVRPGVRADDGDVEEERVLASCGDDLELFHLQIAPVTRALDDGGDGVHILECCCFCCESGGINRVNLGTLTSTLPKFWEVETLRLRFGKRKRNVGRGWMRVRLQVDGGRPEA